jgi:tRNA threonylcarbamoyladenosine biosynthesis protein TsaE
MNAPIAISSESVDATLALGRRIGGALGRGWVIGLLGELGVGKTHLVKGIAAGNAENAAVEVTSPTFVLINEYPGRVALYHIDAYRLRGAADLEELGLEEMVADGAVVIEWADRVADALPPDRLTIAGQATGPTQRQWTFSSSGAAAREWLSRIG